MLVAKNNPKNIRDVADLTRTDVSLFLSNPQTEKVSHQGYAAALRRAASHLAVAADFLDPSLGRLIYGECIHHREAPEAVAQGSVDVAVVYHHLALRYCRVFPNQFDMLPLISKERDQVEAPQEDRSRVSAGLLNGARAVAQAFYEFLDSARVTDIYDHHGLDRPT